MKKNDLRYLAGYFDADGFVGMMTKHQRGRSYYYPQLEVGGIRRAPLDLFVQTFGGTLQRKVNHSRPQEQQMMKWHLSGRRCEPVLQALAPYLLVKQRQALLVLRYFRECYRAQRTWPRLTSRETERRVVYKCLLTRLKRGDID